MLFWIPALIPYIKKENLYSEDLSLIKVRLLDTAFFTYESIFSDQSLSEKLKTSEFLKVFI